MATDYMAQATALNKENEEQQKKQAETKKAELKTQTDQDIASAEKSVGEQIKTTEQDYLDIVASNDLQRELDKRQIAETMANLGLSKSGLNATQQTAVQLSAGNKNYAALQQRQKAVDTLRQSLEDYRTQMANKLRESEISIDEATQKAIADYNANTYKTATEASVKEYEAEQEANAKIAEASQRALEKQNSAYLEMLKNNIITLPQYELLVSGKTLTDIANGTVGGVAPNNGEVNEWSWLTTGFTKDAATDTMKWWGKIDDNDTLYYYDENGIKKPKKVSEIYAEMVKEAEGTDIDEDDIKDFLAMFDKNTDDNTTKYRSLDGIGGWYSEDEAKVKYNAATAVLYEAKKIEDEVDAVIFVRDNIGTNIDENQAEIIYRKLGIPTKRVQEIINNEEAEE